MATFTEIRAPQAALDEWTARRGEDVTSTSITQMIELLQLSEDVQEQTFKREPGEEDGGLFCELSLSFPFVDEGGVQSFMAGSESELARVVTNLSREPLIRFSNWCLKGVYGRSIDDFLSSVNLGGIKLPLGDDGDGSAGSLLERFYTPCAVDETQKIGKLIGQTADQWPCSHARTLVDKIASMLPDAAFQITIPSHDADPENGTAWKCASKDDWALIADTFIVLHQIATTFLYLNKRFVQQAVALGRETEFLKVEIENGVHHLRTNICQGTLLFKKIDGRTEFYNMPAPCPKLQHLYDWLTEASESCTMFCKSVFAQLVEDVLELSAQTEKATPRYEHFANDKIFNRPLCKKNLLGWPSRDLLNTLSVRLFNAMSELSRLYTEWKFEPKLINHSAEWSESIATISSVYASARAAVSTIAAVNVILELKDPEKHDQADFILKSKRKDLPITIAQELDKITSKVPVAPAKVPAGAPAVAP